MTRDSHRGPSRAGVLVVIACVAIFVVVVVVAMQRPERSVRNVTYELKNQAQALNIVQALVSAADEEGRYPHPGLHWRLPDPELGMRVPGRGPEDVTKNTTAHLYAMLVSLNYVNADTLVSPLERNPSIPPPAPNFTGSGGDPWSPEVAADVETGSVASYAHMPIFGDRGWRRVADASLLQLGNRGPASGIATQQSWSCRANGDWVGAFIFADLHGEPRFIERGEAIGSPSIAPGDNPFMPDGAVIAFTKAMTERGPVLQHD